MLPDAPPTPFRLAQPPRRWQQLGCVMPRGGPGAYDSRVTGDPCVVRDEQADAWRTFYFAMGQVSENENCANAQAMLRLVDGRPVFEKLGPIVYENKADLRGSAHKPWIVMDPTRPGEPARPDGRIWLLSAVYRGANKVIVLSTAETLAGPWRVEPEPLVNLGQAEAFDGYHADSPTGWWFPDREQVLVYYKGYPRHPQADQPLSPLGSSLAAVVVDPATRRAHHVGRMLPPVEQPGHWASGWMGPMQLFAAEGGGWWGLLSASPTPPAPVEESPRMREPAPSQGGWAYTAAAWPVGGWELEDEPIVRADAVPADAAADGEGVNFWRHHLAVLDGSRALLLYNSGPYGEERLFGRMGSVDAR